MTDLNQMETIAEAFGLSAPKETVRLSGGHIHESYRVTVYEGTFLFQKIGESLLPELSVIMENAAVIEALYPAGCRYRKAFGRPVYRDGNGACWRVSEYRFGTVRTSCDTPEEAYETGRAFGLFLSSLKAAPKDAIRKTIPHFHDTEWYEEELKKELSKLPEEETGPYRKLAERFESMLSQTRYREIRKTLPVRIVHNDVKPGNVIFPETGEGIVIDWDTVMPGFVWYDFGDGIRSAAVTEHADGSRSTMPDTKKAAAFAEGFRSACKTLTDAETGFPVEAAVTVTCELGIRYLLAGLTDSGYFQDCTREKCVEKASFYAEYAEHLRDTLPGVFLDSYRA